MSEPAKPSREQTEQVFHRDRRAKQSQGVGRRHRKAGRTLQVQALVRRLAAQGIR